MGVINDTLLEYINSLQPLFDGKLGEVQKNALECGYPIISPATARFLSVTLSVVRPKNVLEIGCAVGFSAGLISKYLQKDGQVTTIDRFPFMIERAKANFEYMEINHIVTLLEGDAADILPRLEGLYDFIFLDAAKGQYITFLPECLRLLEVGGVIVADNVLQGGTIAEDRLSIKRRQRTIHTRLRQFLWAVSNADGLESSIVPIGDGIVICKKTKKDVVIPTE